MSIQTSVKTAYGTYLGLVNEDGVAEFRGIPYAKTPRRWQEAELPEPSDGIFEAFEFGPCCVQPVWPSDAVEGAAQSEDCLKLNICTNDITAKGRPVMVFIHGGSYITGNPAQHCYYGDKLAADRDVVFVNFAYRMGLFGSMNFASVDSEGKYSRSVNLTTKDQLLALKWIKENIGCFGGDPDNITVFGQSAGSFSISVLMSVEDGPKYFNKAICESGVFDDNSINSPERSREIGDWFIERAGIKSVEDLEALDVDTLRKIDEEIFFKFPLAYSPVKDGEFVPSDPLRAVLEGNAKNISLMIGNAEGDGERLLTTDLQPHKDRALKTVNPKVINEAVLEQYCSNYPERKKLTAYQEIVSDVRYRLPSLMLAKAQSLHNKVYVYLWRWSDPSYPTRAPHGIELPFVMDKPAADKRTVYEFGKIQGENPPEKLIKEAQAAWCGFASCGDPGSSDLIPDWPAYSEEDKCTMIIDSSWSLEKDYHGKDSELLLPRFPEYRRLF